MTQTFTSLSTYRPEPPASLSKSKDLSDCTQGPTSNSRSLPELESTFALEVGSTTETVEVTASTPLIEADTTSLGTVVDQRETNELPLNGRNPMNLTALARRLFPWARRQIAREV